MGGGPAVFLAVLLERRLLQSCTVPMSEIGGGVIRALAKIEQRIPGGGGGAHIIIHQQEFAQLFVVKRRRGAHRPLAKSIRRGHRVGIECRSFDVASARPKTHAADFVRIRLPSHGVRAGAFRRAAPGKARHCKIKAAPKEMDRADFADESRTKFLENRIHGDKNSPECVSVLWDRMLRGYGPGQIESGSVSPPACSKFLRRYRESAAERKIPRGNRRPCAARVEYSSFRRWMC